MTVADISRYFGQYRRLAETFPEVIEGNYFDGPFFDFEGPAARTQTWDIESLTHLVNRTGASVVADIGCGEGRITAALRDNGVGDHWIGIEESVAACAAFRKSFADATDVELEAASLFEAQSSFDCGVLGSVTVNSFSSQEVLHHLLSYVHGQLTDSGSLVVTCFAEGTSSQFEKLSGAADAQAFTSDDGRPRLLWRALRFDGVRNELLHNFFIEDQSSFPGFLAHHLERIWTPDELVSAGSRVGLQLVDTRDCAVSGGGADNWPCVSLLLQKN